MNDASVFLLGFISLVISFLTSYREGLKWTSYNILLINPTNDSEYYSLSSLRVRNTLSYLTHYS